MQPPAIDPAAAAAQRVLVWDLPTRLFHWLLAASFLGAYLVSESERWRGVHALLGYTAAALIAFRLLWGVAGTRYARFSGFALSLRALSGYLKSLVTGAPRHYVGHNPAGSWAVVALLALVAATAVSGWAVLNAVGPGWLEDLHEACANATLALVALHVAAVVVSKRAAAAAAAAGSRRWVAAALLMVLIALWGGWIPAPGLERGTGLAGIPAPTAKLQPEGGRSAHERQRDRHPD
jgi:cytochrome b